ncbi:MAG: iron-containing alcohol dehydrogenase [Thermodesulfobacteriota bacterium]|nr:iron-containing alcohol dehydrogenase [Thermodesulfobacteriota bacterium]
MLPSYYEYYNPVKILSGNRALENLASELEVLGVCRPVLITDKGVTGAGLVKLVKKSFANSGVTIGAIFDDVPPDSSSRVVSKIAGIYRRNKCDSLVAVGGGSVIDTAKGVNILITENSDDLMKFAGAEMLKKPMKPLIVIPSTSGTGSEVTSVAVISDIERNIKMAFTSNHLLPKIALLDPRMTLTLPPAMTAATGMDALSHAVEGFINLQKNPMSDAYSFAAIELIRKNLVKAVEDGKDADVRLSMANAAAMAGASFSNSMVGIVHALGHAAGGVCHVPHGVAMNIFLPFGLEYNFSKRENEIARLLLPIAGAEEYARTPESRRAKKTIEHIRGLQRALNDLCDLPMTLKQANVPIEKLPLIADTAINDPSLAMNPRDMDRDDALKILNQAFE